MTLSARQQQTSDAFGFKWGKRDTYESSAFLARTHAWLVERYGTLDVEQGSTVLDAGCGAGLSALELFGDRLRDVSYIGVDVSEAVEVARQRFTERGIPGRFIRGDITNLDLADGSVDLVFSEGVLHHTDSTERAFHAVARLVKMGGRIAFYVYRRKGPIREFTDDHIRDLLQTMTPEEGWDALLPLTRLGKLLGDLDVTIDVPEAIDVLGIPAGPISLQRLVYWHVVKAFHTADSTLEELNHINYDWFAPRNAHRQTEDDVRRWCSEAGFTIEREVVEDAGITVVARKDDQPAT